MDKDTVTKAVDYTDPAVFKYFTRPQIDALDFTGFPEKYGYAKLDELIPKNPKYGKNDPPSQYLSSGKKVREWRSISGGNQKHILDNPRPAAVTRDTSRRAARREGRRRRRGHDSTDPAAQQLEQIANNNDAVPSPLAKRRKVQQQPVENISSSSQPSNVNVVYNIPRKISGGTICPTRCRLWYIRYGE